MSNRMTYSAADTATSTEGTPRIETERRSAYNDGSSADAVLEFIRSSQADVTPLRQPRRARTGPEHGGAHGQGKLIVVSNRVALPRDVRAGGLASALKGMNTLTRPLVIEARIDPAQYISQF